MKKIIAISLALLMLVSNIGFSINTHFCGGKAVKTSFSLGLHNPDCGMAKMEQECEDVPAQGGQMTQKPCCENQHQILQSDGNVNTHSSKISVNPAFFIAFVQAFVQPVLFVEPTLVHHTDYSPPIPDKDVQVLFQIFLI